jgi:hypothetical protein
MPQFEMYHNRAGARSESHEFEGAAQYDRLDFLRGDLPSWFGGFRHGELCPMRRKTNLRLATHANLSWRVFWL